MHMKFLFFLILYLFHFFVPTFAQWTHQDSGVTNELSGICFVDSFHGWIVGSDGLILRTADGGIYWHDINLDSEKSK